MYIYHSIDINIMQALQVTLANKTQEWDIVKTFAEIVDFHKVVCLIFFTAYLLIGVISNNFYI